MVAKEFFDILIERGFEFKEKFAQYITYIHEDADTGIMFTCNEEYEICKFEFYRLCNGYLKSHHFVDENFNLGKYNMLLNKVLGIKNSKFEKFYDEDRNNN